jgi:hypothetical protein
MTGLMHDWTPAQQRVAELMASQQSCGLHHPTHPEQGPEEFRLVHAPGAGPDDFLKSDDIRVDVAKDVSDPLGPSAPVESPAAMNVVGDDAETARVSGHEWMRIDAAGRACE